MRADVVAAFFDCRDTREMARQVVEGEIPRPTSERRAAGRREPLWALEACRRFVASRHGIVDAESAAEDVVDLI